MKKKLSAFFILLILVMGLNAQHYNITRNDFEQVKITFTTAELQTKTVKTDRGDFTQISMDDYYPSTEVGKPQLPTMVQLLQIPVCDSVIAVVKNAQYVELDASECGIEKAILPAQPSYPKSYRGERTFAMDQTIYSKNDFYAQPLVRVEKAGIMRDVCLANIYVSPMMYNPVTKKVRLYKSVEVEISFVNANLPATYELQTRYGSPMFQTAAAAVANPMPRTRDEFAQAPIKYLIVAHSMFSGNEDLQNFVNWKKRMGYLVEVAYTSDANVGTTNTSIKNFIKSKYTNATAEDPAPTFLLLVGDHAQIPATSSTELNSHITDLYFATWTSGDNIPDCYYGRFSAENASHLTPQIEKTLMYEQYTMPDPSYLGNAVLIAGTDSYWSSTHADGQINYIYNNYMNPTSTTHNYTTVYKHNYNCSSQAATIRSEIGAGCSWANYTAHGEENGWSDPSFKTTNVSSMNNADKYGVMIGNCCLTGTFNYSSPCFGETLLRTSGKGAMAYIGASEVSYWDEDAYWAVGKRNSVTANMTYNAANLGAYDRIFHTHDEDHANWNTSIGAFLQGGNLAVQSSSSSKKKYYWEIYHLFGDPSIKPYMGIPATMTVSSSDAIMTGASSYQVTAVPYAYVALTHNNTLIGAAFADASGSATINFSALSVPGEYELAVSAQNYIQYFKTVNVIVPEGPYVIATDVPIVAGEYPINGTEIHLALALENLGVDAASNVTATLTSNTAGYTVTQASANVGNINVNATANVNNAFAISIPQNAIDGERASFTVTVNWQGGSSTKDVLITVLAPNVVITNSIQSTTGASSFQPGDNAVVTLTIKNEGHAAASNIMTDVTCNYSGVVVTSASQNITYLDSEETTTHNFDVQISSSVPTVSLVPLYIHAISNGIDDVDTIFLTVGTAMETFETGDFSAFNWTQNSNPWTITDASPYAGTYCARSKQSLSHNDESELSITINCMMDSEISFFRKVSSESNYDFFYFYIDGQKMDEVSGTASWTQKSFPVTAGTHTFKFSYEKDYSTVSGSDCAWIDNIVFPGLGTIVTEDTEDPISVEDFKIANWQVYPNPTTGKFTVFSDQQSTIQSVNVYDMYGKLVQTVTVNDIAATLDLTSLANGLYVVKIIGENETVKTTKIIKQ